MGINQDSLQNFLDNVGIHEENPELVLDFMDSPNYVNTLKAGMVNK